MMRPVIVSLLVCLSAATLAQDFSGRADISYSEANPDYSPFPNGEGTSLFAKLFYLDQVFLTVRTTDSSFKPSGPVSGAEVEKWQEFGLGYRQRFNEFWALELSYLYQEIKQAGDYESGHENQIGVVYSPLDKLDLELSLGKLDLQIDDWNLDFEARYSVFENVYLTAKLRDYADWDFTFYEAGIGVSF